jgi:hypothetical protein
MAQVEEHLPSKPEVLTPVIKKKKLNLLRPAWATYETLS